ncbi:hypothetical protein [Clostridium baratii]|nr:hypothetical protein [Clostridium baratii]
MNNDYFNCRSFLYRKTILAQKILEKYKTVLAVAYHLKMLD